MFILDGGKTHYAEHKKGNISTMQHPVRTELFPSISYMAFHNHGFTTSYFFEENVFYI